MVHDDSGVRRLVEWGEQNVDGIAVCQMDQILELGRFGCGYPKRGSDCHLEGSPRQKSGMRDVPDALHNSEIYVTWRKSWQ